MKKIKVFFTFLLLTAKYIFGQSPRYTPIKFVSTYDSLEFKKTKPTKNGIASTYFLIMPDIWDIDDDHTTHIRSTLPVLVCIEGPYKNSKKNGVFKSYIIDSLDHTKRYKIWEQNYSNDKLSGEWKTFNLKGTVVYIQTFKNDSLYGITREYWIDGKKITHERVYFGNSNKYLEKLFDKSGKLERELMFENGKLNGKSKRYYESGMIKEVVVFLDGKFHGNKKYYYDSGKLWTEMEYNQGKPWNIISNFDDKGNKRDAGTLNNGNGTVILYNEDGKIREIVNYKDGIKQ